MLNVYITNNPPISLLALGPNCQHNLPLVSSSLFIHCSLHSLLLLHLRGEWIIKRISASISTAAKFYHNTTIFYHKTSLWLSIIFLIITMTYNGHPFQLLEINVISAQDLAPVSKSMRTYAVVWVHPERKLTTKVDQNGHTNPQWNEKFVFRVDDTFLNAETSAIMIEIYAAAWLRDVQIGSVRVLISNLFPSNNNSAKMRFVALQIRRPSGRPQGILNLGVQLLDNTMRSMPLYTELSASAVGFNELIDAKTKTIEEKTATLRRTKSDRTDFTTSTADDSQYLAKDGGRGGGSLINGGYGGSLISSSIVKTSTSSGTTSRASKEKRRERERERDIKGRDIGGIGNGSMVSDVGPSASVVAAAIAKGLIKTPANAPEKISDGAGSSILDDWTESDSVEGLRTKLERWRTELPPIYDSDMRKMQSKSRQKRQQRRRRSEGGLFSCFGNAFGVEISITCGGGGGSRSKRRNGNGKVCHLSSVDSQSYCEI